MRGGITAVAALVLLGALWFLAGDDDGRNAVPRLFDNMNDRPRAASPAAATCWRRGARFIWRIAPFATERTEADAEAWPLMTPIRK